MIKIVKLTAKLKERDLCKYQKTQSQQSIQKNLRKNQNNKKNVLLSGVDGMPFLVPVHAGVDMFTVFDGEFEFQVKNIQFRHRGSKTTEKLNV